MYLKKTEESLCCVHSIHVFSFFLNCFFFVTPIKPCYHCKGQFWNGNLVKTGLQVTAAVIRPLITKDLIKSFRSSPHSHTHFALPLSLQLYPTHTLSPLSQCGVHTSRFSIPATKPQQQGGNDPATTAVMMESVGGLAGSLTLPNKSPNNSVNIRADLATGSNTLTPGRPPHMALGNLSDRKTVADQCTLCCGPYSACSVHSYGHKFWLTELQKQ